MLLIRMFILSICLVVGLLPYHSSHANIFSFHNPLVDAADSGQLNEVRALLRARNAVDGRGDFNTTALMRAAYRGHVEIAELLINSGANLGIQDRGGATALHVAARAGHVPIINLLLKNRARIDVKDNEGWTPLMRAVMGKHPKVVEILVDAGGSVLAENNKGQTPVVQAAASGSLDVLSALMESDDFKQVSLERKEEALALARKRKHRNLETVFAALIHPPAAPHGYAAGSQRHDGRSAATAQQSMGGERFDVAVPDNGYEPMPRAQQAFPQQRILPNRLKDDATYDAMMAAKMPAPDYAQDKPYTQSSRAVPVPAFRPPSRPSFARAPVNAAQPVNYGQPYVAPSPVYLLQLGAFANEDQAFYVWNNLQQRHAGVLGGLQPDVMKALLAYNQSQVYRLRAGNFVNKSLAEEACSQMRQQNVECFVIEKSGVAPIQPPQVPQYTAQAPQAPQPGYQPPMAAQPYGGNHQQAMAYPPQFGAPQAQASLVQAQPQPPAEAAGMNAAPNLSAYAPPRPAPPAMPQQVAMPAAPSGQYPTFYDNHAAAQPPAYANAQQPTPYQSGAPISASAIPTPTPSPAYNPQYAANNMAPTSSMTDNEVREMARKEFFRSQGTPAPTPQDHGDFYRDIQQLEQQRQHYGGVSEAVRVNARTTPRRANVMASPQQMRGIWVNVGDFPDERYAQDYYQRMFKFDRSFSHLRMMSIKETLPFAGQTAVSMRLGPTGSEAEAYEICRIVEQGGLQCHILPDESTAGYKQFETAAIAVGRNPQQEIFDPLWVTLGTFEQSSDAEYYWMYLLEDHFDVLGTLKYDLQQRAKNRQEPYQLKAGPFNVVQQASRICDVLKYRNVACVVTH